MSTTTDFSQMGHADRCRAEDITEPESLTAAGSAYPMDALERHEQREVALDGAHPDGCFYCGSRTHRTDGCTSDDRGEFFDSLGR